MRFGNGVARTRLHRAHCKQRHMYIVPQVPAGAPCSEIDSRANEGIWARSVPFTAPTAAEDPSVVLDSSSAQSSFHRKSATFGFLAPKVAPVIDINGGFKQLKSDGKVPFKWDFLPSSSGT
jgi:hypothetical protein